VLEKLQHALPPSRKARQPQLPAAQRFHGIAKRGGPLGSRVSMLIGATGYRSRRFLDPVHPDNLHNDGDAGRGEAQLTWDPGARDLISANIGGGRSAFQVPHGEVQEIAGQDQRQELTYATFGGSWQRTWSNTKKASVVAFKRPARCASATISLMRASMIGVRPESIISTLARLTSTPITLWPMEAKQAADTEPTYPNPKMLTDKPKRILLAIVFLGLLRGTRNYINPLLSDSKSRSIGLLEVLGPIQQ